MNKPLSEKYTIDIIKRLEKASGAPWFSSESTYVINNVEGDSWEWDADLIAETKSKEDAQFIAHARQDIPKLLAEIDRLEEILHDAYGEIRRGKNGRAINIIEEWGCDNE